MYTGTAVTVMLAQMQDQVAAGKFGGTAARWGRTRFAHHGAFAGRGVAPPERVRVGAVSAAAPPHARGSPRIAFLWCEAGWRGYRVGSGQARCGSHKARHSARLKARRI